MKEKTTKYDNSQLVANVARMVGGTVIQKLGLLGRDFHTDPRKFDDKTQLEEARTEIMYNILEEIAQTTGTKLVQYNDIEQYNQKSGKKYTTKEKVILLDPQSIRKIEQSLDKIIVEMATTILSAVDKRHQENSPGRKNKSKMDELTYNTYLLEAAKFIYNTPQEFIETRTYRGPSSSFREDIPIAADNGKLMQEYFQKFQPPFLECPIPRTEEEINKWIEEQEVEGQPLWSYLLNNHFEDLNGTKGSELVPKLAPLREHVMMRIIDKHKDEILNKIDEYPDKHKESLKRLLQGNIEARLILLLGTQESSIDSLSQVVDFVVFSKQRAQSLHSLTQEINNINDKNANLYSLAIGNVSRLKDFGPNSYGATFLNMLKEIPAKQTQKDKAISVMLEIIPKDDQDGKLRKSLESNIASYILADEQSGSSFSPKQAERLISKFQDPTHKKAIQDHFKKTQSKEIEKTTSKLAEDDKKKLLDFNNFHNSDMGDGINTAEVTNTIISKLPTQVVACMVEHMNPKVASKVILHLGDQQKSQEVLSSLSNKQFARVVTSKNFVNPGENIIKQLEDRGINISKIEPSKEDTKLQANKAYSKLMHSTSKAGNVKSFIERYVTKRKQFKSFADLIIAERSNKNHIDQLNKR